MKNITKAQQPIKQFRAQRTSFRNNADQCFVVNLLPDELVLTEGVAGFSCDGVYGSLLHLLLDGTVKHEQGLASTLLKREVTDLVLLPTVKDMSASFIFSFLAALPRLEVSDKRSKCKHLGQKDPLDLV